MADERLSLDRLLRPRSVAIVGASDKRPGVHAKPTLESGCEIFLVNPRRDEVWGRPTVPTLAAIGRPVDAVMSYLPATETLALAKEAIALGCGGLVSIASGFADGGAEGKQRQQERAAMAREARFPILGPNGVGYLNVPRRLSLTMVTDHDRRPGGLSIVAQSGAMLTSTV